jgi:predicted nucleotidyltransferase
VAIPNDVLISWARPGKDEMSKQTYSALKEVIQENIPGCDVRLQGSYANSTNVRDNSDIDILVMCKGFSSSNQVYQGLRPLSELKHIMYNSINGKRNYIFSEGKKTIEYKDSYGLGVPADIVPCVKFTMPNGKDAIALYNSSTGQTIHNYPFQHIENGESKSGRTNGNYKKSIRMFKNARNKLVSDHSIDEKCAPSYFIECLIYNAPDSLFAGSEPKVFNNVLNWIWKGSLTYTADMVCQNGITKLFGNESTQWNVADFVKFRSQLFLLRSKWRS